MNSRASSCCHACAYLPLSVALRCHVHACLHATAFIVVLKQLLAQLEAARVVKTPHRRCPPLLPLFAPLLRSSSSPAKLIAARAVPAQLPTPTASPCSYASPEPTRLASRRRNRLREPFSSQSSHHSCRGQLAMASALQSSCRHPIFHFSFALTL